MSRSLTHSPLPELNQVLQPPDLSSCPNKSYRISDLLRPLILQHQGNKSILFYPLREIASHFKVSLRTAQLARQQLEKDGLLINVRGSHSKIPATGKRHDSEIQGVVGMPYWLFGARYSHLHKNLPYALGELLWKHNLVLETIPYSEVEDLKPDFCDHLLRHKMDFALWLFPFRHNRPAIQRLAEAGVQNLIVGHHLESSPLSPQVMIDSEPAILDILAFWREKYGIEKLLIPQGFEYDRGRAKSFIRLAQSRGFTCRMGPCQPNLAGSFLQESEDRNEPMGIVLLDEHASAEFSLCDPVAFCRLAKIHRILFVNNLVNLPFINNNELTVERIGTEPVALARLIVKMLSCQRLGETNSQRQHFDSHYDKSWRLKRYI